MLSNLLGTYFIKYYSITRNPSIDEVLTNDSEFDLDDMSSPIKIFPYRSGALSFMNNGETLEIIHYEDYINQCKKPLLFSQGKKKCDYLLTDKDCDHFFILVEITSALGSPSNLTKPIYDKKGKLLYGGGKYEKGAIQLAESLETLIAVPAIKSYVDQKFRKLCLLAYKINPISDPVQKKMRPMQRYLEIESAETGENGAELSEPTINSYGFHFIRINHTAAFNLKR